ncbi:MAG: flagellar protein FlaG [Sulfurimonas sp.]
MDGIANVAKQQQTQVGTQELQTKNVGQTQQVSQVKREVQESTNISSAKINSKEDMDQLVKKLNDALSPISTNIKFRVDSQNIFYVSVIEADTNKMIRRFPAEKAQQVLPKMEEVNGILFDSKG